MMRLAGNYIRPFLMGMALLTRIPVTQWLSLHWDTQELARSALYYPLIGALMAFLLSLCAWLLPEGVSPWVGAMMVLILWVLLSGGLHLDGLADCVDALYAGHSVLASPTMDEANNPQRDKILHVLKDPHTGSMAVITLCLVLLAKLVLLASLWPELGIALLLSLLIARSMAVLLMVYTPYTPFAANAGIGAIIANHTDKQSVVLIHCALLVLALICLPLNSIFWLTLVLGTWFLLWRRYWVKLVGGFVGDTVGALIEISEVLVLLLLYCLAL